MTEEDIKYYESLIDLTADPKWQALTEELKKEIWQIQGNILESATNEQQLYFAKGYTAALSTMVNLRENAKQVLDNKNEL